MESISTRRRCFAVIASTPRHSPVDSAQCCAVGPSSFDGAVAPSAAASLSLVNVNVGGGVIDLILMRTRRQLQRAVAKLCQAVLCL